MKAISDDHRVSMTRRLDSTEFSENHQENKLLHADLRDGEVLVETSRSLCPKCLKVIECQIVSRENKVYMRKFSTIDLSGKM